MGGGERSLGRKWQEKRTARQHSQNKSIKSGMYNLGTLTFLALPPVGIGQMIGWWKIAGDGWMDGRWGGGARHRAAATYSTLTVPPGSLQYNNGAGTSFSASCIHTHITASCSDVTASHTTYISIVS